MSTTPTPRVDEVMDDTAKETWEDSYFAMRRLARQLERELAEANESRIKWAESSGQMQAERNQARRELAEAKAAAIYTRNGMTASAMGWALMCAEASEQRDMLAEALRTIRKRRNAMHDANVPTPIRYLEMSMHARHLERELIETREQRDRMAEALELLMPLIANYPGARMFESAMSNAKAKAREALAAVEGYKEP